MRRFGLPGEGKHRPTLPCMTLRQRQELGRRLDAYALHLQEESSPDVYAMERAVRTTDIGYRPRDGSAYRSMTISRLIAEHPSAEKLTKEYFGLLYQYGSAVQEGDYDRAAKARVSIIGFVERLML
jgi:hypothetical protein